MEQNEQARLSALSNASMLSAIGVTLMYGLSLLLALLSPASVAVGVVSPIGLILWLVGIYNTSSAFKGFNAAVAASFERLFKAQLVIVIIAVVAYWVLIILIPLILIPQILGYNGAKASIVIIKLLTIALFVCSIMYMAKSNKECRTLKGLGLKSMGTASIAFTIQLVILAVSALIAVIALFRTGDFLSFLIGDGLGGAVVLTILMGLAALVAAVFMIIGWWSVRNELPLLSADEKIIQTSECLLYRRHIHPWRRRCVTASTAAMCVLT